MTLPKTWYCPHYSRLPQFKRKRGKSHAQNKNQQNAFNKKAPQVCVCEVKATSNDRLLECHSQRCRNGKFFHLGCLRLKRMPNNSKTTWQFPACRKSKFQPTTCIFSSSEIESENEVAFVKKTVGSINKTSVLANLTSTDFYIINDPNGGLIAALSSKHRCYYSNIIHCLMGCSDLHFAERATLILLVVNLYKSNSSYRHRSLVMY